MEIAVRRVAADFSDKPMPLDIAIAFDGAASVLNRHHAGEHIRHGEAATAGHALVLAARYIREVRA